MGFWNFLYSYLVSKNICGEAISVGRAGELGRVSLSHLEGLEASMCSPSNERGFLFLKRTERQIPYDLTFNWNIINRRKKETKYNQRH